uniref:Bm9614 n=1 Tax=Brugia malayi TaxID=6279 RepID=A0A1I9GCK4_BRUMA|nr:Bm9614 [Brugia malayi]
MVNKNITGKLVWIDMIPLQKSLKQRQAVVRGAGRTFVACYTICIGGIQQCDLRDHRAVHLQHE